MQRVFEHIDAPARERGVAVVPAVGFDNVPGDLACALAAAGDEPLRELVDRLRGQGLRHDTRDDALGARDAHAARTSSTSTGRCARRRRAPCASASTFPGPLGAQSVASTPAARSSPCRGTSRTRDASASADPARSFAPHPRLARGVPARRSVIGALLRTPLRGALDGADRPAARGPGRGRAARERVHDRRRGRTARTAGSARAVVEGSDVYGITAVIAVEIARRMGDRRLRPRGALAPAQVVDAEDFLDFLGEHGVSYRVESRRARARGPARERPLVAAGTCPACGGLLRGWRSAAPASPAASRSGCCAASACGTAVTAAPAPARGARLGRLRAPRRRGSRGSPRRCWPPFDRQRLWLLRAPASRPRAGVDAGAGRGRFVAAARRGRVRRGRDRAVARAASRRRGEAYGRRAASASAIEDAPRRPGRRRGDALARARAPRRSGRRARSGRAVAAARRRAARRRPEPRQPAGAARRRARWFHLDLPRHRTHFTPEGLAALLAAHGFDGRAHAPRARRAQPVRPVAVARPDAPAVLRATTCSSATSRPGRATLAVTAAALPLAPVAAVAELAAGLAAARRHDRRARAPALEPRRRAQHGQRVEGDHAAPVGGRATGDQCDATGSRQPPSACCAASSASRNAPTVRLGEQAPSASPGAGASARAATAAPGRSADRRSHRPDERRERVERRVGAPVVRRGVERT